MAKVNSSFCPVTWFSRIKDVESAKSEIDTLGLLREELLKTKSDYYANQVMIEIKSAQAWLQLSKGK